MAAITRRGRDLAWRLNPYIGTTTKIEETCSLIARHAKTYNWIQEAWCDNEYICTNDAARERYEAKEEWLEGRIRDLVDILPHTDHGPIKVIFGDDPRGATVALHVPTDWGHTVIAAEWPA